MPVTGCGCASKGEPLAKTARPSDHASACAKVHSALLVGLDNGMMMGRSLYADMRRMTCGGGGGGT